MKFSKPWPKRGKDVGNRNISPRKGGGMGEVKNGIENTN